MKKNLSFYFLLLSFFATVTTKAQTFPPAYSAKACTTVQIFIQNYQGAPNHHPSAFLLNASGLRDYFSSLGENDSAYLHIYLASWTGLNADNFLGMIGAKYNGTNMYHDPNMTYLLVTNKVDPNLCTIYDSNIDDVDRYDPPLCDINNCINSTYSKAAMHNYIVNYQSNHMQGSGPSYANTQSFLINATAIRKFLNTQSNVKYLQFYLGKRNSLPNLDHYTLGVVGVDMNGYHVYYGNSGCVVFDEDVPCPSCGITYDTVLDYQAQ